MRVKLSFEQKHRAKRNFANRVYAFRLAVLSDIFLSRARALTFGSSGRGGEQSTDKREKYRKKKKRERHARRRRDRFGFLGRRLHDTVRRR